MGTASRRCPDRCRVDRGIADRHRRAARLARAARRCAHDAVAFLVDAVVFYRDTLRQAVGVYLSAGHIYTHTDPGHSNEGAVMYPDTQPDPFDQFADSLDRAVHRYRNAHAQHVDRTHARAELVALCDLIATAEHPDRAADRDPVPDGLADRVLLAVHDADPHRQPLGAVRHAQRDDKPEPQPVHECDDGKPLDLPCDTDPEPEVVDLVAALRSSIEAAKARRRAAADGQ